MATSGAVAIILGLALQSTLGDVFSGVVLSFSRPYRPGDWISLEGGTDGRVIEINWRATYVLTGRRDLAIVPNSKGRLQRSSVLVSNFNNLATADNPGGQQGRGTTIVEVAPGGQVQPFLTASSVAGSSTRKSESWVSSRRRTSRHLISNG